ncbi:hypothetical protein ACQ4PT_033911 [Festuca glaucescens]
MRLQIHRKLDRHTGCVNTVGFNADGDILISGSDDQKVMLWDWDTGAVKMQFHSGHGDNVFQAWFMPYTDDRSIVTCAADGQFDLRTNTATELFVCRNSLTKSGYSSHVHLNAITTDPRNPNLLAVGGSNPFARVYDIRKCKWDGSSDFAQPSDCYCPPHLIGDRGVGITGLAFSHQSELLVSYNNENIYLFAKNGGLGPDPKPSAKIEGSKGSKSTTFASGEAVYLPVPQIYVGHRNCETVKGVTFIGPNHEYVASGSDCGRLFIWRKRDGKFLRAMEGDECIVNCIEPHPHTMTIASSGIDNDVKLWTPSAIEQARVLNVEELKPRKRKAKLWHFALPEELVMHVLAQRRQPAAGEDSSEDLEDNTELLSLVLQAADRDNSSDDSDEDEEISDGSGSRAK